MTTAGDERLTGSDAAGGVPASSAARAGCASRSPETSAAPLVAHVVYRFDVGGLENGLVNLINRTPEGRYRHAIVCLTGYTGFRERLTEPASVFALNKAEGKDPAHYVRLWRLLRRLRPDIVHTRNLTTMEAQVPAWLAGVPGRVHGEHGRDVHDLDGRNRRYQWLRRVCRPLVHQYIALSGDLEEYLVDRVGVSKERLSRVRNGVDTERFSPAGDGGRERVGAFAPPGSVVIGTVGRLEPVKDQLTLVRAFIALARMVPDPSVLRLLVVGDGSLRRQAQGMLEEAGLAGQAWFAGTRDDVAAMYRAMDVFVLPSLAEGICNTILEAMACGLPVVATDVGGNGELVTPDVSGHLVPCSDPQAMAQTLRRYVDHPEVRAEHGRAARQRAVEEFSLQGMVERYLRVYDRVISRRCGERCG